MKKRMLAGILASAVLCLLFCGCGDTQKAAVSVQSVGLLTGMGSVGLTDSFAGVVSTGDSCGVERDPEMKIKELLVAAGDTVEEGQILFTYDTEAISLSLDKMDLELEQMKASVETKTAQIEELEKEKARAKQEDQLDYTLQIQELQIDLTETGLNIKAKEKEIEQTARYLENDQVTAPITGRIQKINENGGYDEMGNPLPYISIAQTTAYRVKGIVNEQNAAALMIGMPVTVRSRVDREQTWSGTVDEIDWENPIQNNDYYYWGESDNMNQSSKYPFYVSLELDEGLKLGQHVYIEPWQEESGGEALMLPAWCLNDADTDAPWVWAVDEKERLEKRPVKLGEYDEATDTYPVLDGLTVKDYVAPPGEDCEVGAAVVYYSESDFEAPVYTGEYFNGEEQFGFSGEEGGFVFEENPDYAFAEDGEYAEGIPENGADFENGVYPDEVIAEEGAVG